MNTPVMQSVKPTTKQTANPFPGPHNKPFNDLMYTVQLTRDDSPTLRLKPTEEEIKSNRMSEAMHHSGGAALESWYIYGAVIEKVFQNALKLEPIRICSVGLGLGYIEMMSSLNAVAGLSNTPNTIEIDSFEIDSGLVSFFLSWIKKENTSTAAVYDLAFKKLVGTNTLFSQQSMGAVQNYLAEALNNNFLIHGNLLDYKKEKKWDIICFDAFSKKFSEDIWSEEFLNDFLKNHCSTTCAFTTYAYTAELKRALLENNFVFLERPGFSNKRKSTLAVRGEIISSELQIHYSRL